MQRRPAKPLLRVQPTTLWEYPSQHYGEGGSGTRLDVAKDTGRRGRGFDLAPHRQDIERADARKLPLESGSVNLVFMDPPYGDHIRYS